MSTMDDAAREASLGLARNMADFWRDRLGDRLLGVYLLGSLAHGGFNRRYSDIDVGVIAEDGLDEGMLDDMRAEATRRAPELAAKLSVFWTDRDFAVGRFPPLDRLDYLDHAVALTEREKILPARPTLNDVRDYLRGAPFDGWATTVARFAAIKTLAPDDHKRFLRVFLYPARFAYSWAVGVMSSNDDAVTYLREHPPEGLDMALIGRALDCRHAAADPDCLFDDRIKLPSMLDACARLIGG
ncbi:MAG: nucleotidyltransferase domain-containing protein [Alphaproteobacteria bacterium]